MVTHAKTFTHIVRRADILGGEPIVAGTRVPVRTIVQYAQIYNDDVKEMEGVYPSIARADIEEALAFYEANREEIDRYIAENEDTEEDRCRALSSIWVSTLPMIPPFSWRSVDLM